MSAAPTSLPRIQELDPLWRVAAIVDVETTGFHRTMDEVVELAVTLFAFKNDAEVVGIIDEYIGLREPKARMSPMAAKVHGITDHELRGQNLDIGQVNHLLSRAEFVIAHNASFDRAFLRGVTPEAENKDWRCTLRHIDWIGYGFENRRLGYLLRAHGIDPGREHRAGTDTQSTLQLLATRNAAGRYYLLDLMGRLRAPGRKTKTPKIQRERRPDGPLFGQVVVVTGTMSNWSREETEDLIEAMGGRASGSVSKKTTLVVAGPGAGSKLRMAQEFGIKIVTEAEFIELIGTKHLTA